MFVRCIFSMIIIVMVQLMSFAPCFGYTFSVQQISEQSSDFVQKILTSSKNGYERLSLFFIKKRSKNRIETFERTIIVSKITKFESDVDDTINTMKKVQEIKVIPEITTENVVNEIYQNYKSF